MRGPVNMPMNGPRGPMPPRGMRAPPPGMRPPPPRFGGGGGGQEERGNTGNMEY